MKIEGSRWQIGADELLTTELRSPIKVMTFEDLDAWKKTRELVNAVYAIARETALRNDFGLCGQIQRAAVSAMSNVAAGLNASTSPKKFRLTMLRVLLVVKSDRCCM